MSIYKSPINYLSALNHSKGNSHLRKPCRCDIPKADGNTCPKAGCDIYICRQLQQGPPTVPPSPGDHVFPKWEEQTTAMMSFFLRLRTIFPCQR